MMHSLSPVPVTLGTRRSRARSGRLAALGALAAFATLAAAPPGRAQTTITAPTVGAPASDAQDQTAAGSADESEALIGPAISLDPTSPQATVLPGGMAPAFGALPQNAQDWRFDFHGLLIAPLNAGFNTRPDARPGQSTTVLHAPPVVPDDLETFSHTGVVPTTYAQLNFSDGNGVVSANVSILAQQANVSESFLEPSSQLGITDAYLKYVSDLARNARLRVLVGAFTSRYGSTGEYDEGRYGTPLIARINGAGELATVKLGLGRYTLIMEQGLQGQTNTASASVTPDVWNDFANPEEGTTFVNHFHVGLGYRSLLTVGAHFINAQSHDDHATGTLQPDGNLTIVAADARLTMGRYGHFYAALSVDNASHARTISRIISVLNAPGGPGLEANYMGPESFGGDATGTMTIAGGQYDLSVGRLINYPRSFTGQGRDLFVSVFALATHVTSDVQVTPAVPPVGGPVNRVYGDGVTKLKFGAEVSYSFLSWLVGSLRYDYVAPSIDANEYSFSVLSPRIILRTSWMATDQLVLQYSHWFDGPLTTVRTGEPPLDNPSVIPDADMLSLSASMWW